MWTKRLRLWRYTLCVLLAVSALAWTVQGEEEVPSESQCRPYIEKALKELESGDVEESDGKDDSSEVSVADETKENDSVEEETDSREHDDDRPSVEVAEEPYQSQDSASKAESSLDSSEDATIEENEDNDTIEDDSKENDEDRDSQEDASADEQAANEESDEKEEQNDEGKDDDDSRDGEKDDSKDGDEDDSKDDAESNDDAEDSKEVDDDASTDSKETDSQEDDNKSEETETDDDSDNESETKEQEDEKSNEVDEEGDSQTQEDEEQSKEDDDNSTVEKTEDDKEESEEDKDEKSTESETEDSADENEDEEGAEADSDSKDDVKDSKEDDESSDDDKTDEEGSDEEGAVEGLLNVREIPDNLRSRDHLHQILRLDEEASEAEITVDRAAEIILRDIKRVYESSIKPLETIYKYRDLSNRHFGDPEIFSKPLVLFMGPWSGGKSSILNYLTGLEFTDWSLRTGAEPSPAYFNILMHGEEPAVLDGTQLAADWTFSGLQKFGQGLEERLRGLKYPSKLLEKVNIVEIPGILEVRKQVSRVFPFNDACQWFIDRADIIFLVYDPSKLDVGPETEAILDQLKGRESQTRIVLNKADTVKAEELMRVQSALIWNISPLMSSAQPPVMYAVSLWSMPYEQGAPVRLLQAQEKELLHDLRVAIDRRIENKIASARRFAVRVRNHAKMVDCYLTTYFNHKTIFGNKKLIADAIIENPQNYHIYEGLSTLTNISRYDLPDPETYRDFFRLNPLYEFQQLSATCTYFRGCPINKLDVAIAYDLPELVGKYKKMVETATPQGMPKS